MIKKTPTPQPIPPEFQRVLDALDRLAAVLLKWKHALGMTEGEGPMCPFNHLPSRTCKCTYCYLGRTHQC